MSNSEVPVQKLGVRVQIQEPRPSVIHQESQDVICDFLNGYAFGNILGVGIQSLKGWWTVETVEISTATTVTMVPLVTPFIGSSTKQGVDVELQVTPLVVAPLQTRIVPFFLRQSAPFPGNALELDIHLKSGSLSETISISLPAVHHQLASSEGQALKGTFLFTGSSPTAFLAIPPALNSPRQQPPILALRQLISKPTFLHLTWTSLQMVQASMSLANLSGKSHCQKSNSAGLLYQQVGLLGYELPRR